MRNEKLLYLLSCLAAKVQNLSGFKTFEPRRIVAVKLDEIGDMIYTLHVFELLRKQYPEAHITVVCKPFNSSLIESSNVVDEVVHDLKDLKGRFDLYLNLRGNWKSFLQAFRAKRRLERGCVRMKSKFRGGQKHEVETNSMILSPIMTIDESNVYPQLNVPTEAENKIEQLLQEHDIKRFVVLHTGARDVARRWPAERFAEIADWLTEKYDLDVILGGGPNEFEDVENVLTFCKSRCYNWAGKTSLLEFAALCSKADLFVGNESGPVHIANIMNTPLVALFGPGVRGVFYPYGDNVRIIHHFNDGNPKLDLRTSSIFLISVGEVKEAIDSLMK